MARPWGTADRLHPGPLLTYFASLSAYYTSGVVLYLRTPASSTIPANLPGGILTSGTDGTSLGEGARPRA
jgi:hypothetical protein